MNFRNAFMFVTVLAISSGCTGRRPGPPPPPQVFEVDAPLNDIWVSTVRWYTDHNLPILNMDRVSAFLRSDEIVLGPEDEVAGVSIRDLVDCGTNHLGAEYTKTGTTYLAIAVLLDEMTQNSTSIRVQLSAHHVHVSDQAPRDKGCVSLGVLEPMVFDFVDSLVRQSSR